MLWLGYLSVTHQTRIFINGGGKDWTIRRVAASESYVWIEPPSVFASLVGSVQIPIASITDARADAHEFSFKIQGLEIKMPGKVVSIALMKQLSLQK